jgi:hypothetical protein
VATLRRWSSHSFWSRISEPSSARFVDESWETVTLLRLVERDHQAD